jgi:hypothetical protein
MSPIPALLTYTFGVISTTAILVLGLCTSIGIVVVVCELLKTISSAHRQLPSNEKDAAKVETSGVDFW